MCGQWLHLTLLLEKEWAAVKPDPLIGDVDTQNAVKSKDISLEDTMQNIGLERYIIDESQKQPGMC